MTIIDRIKQIIEYLDIPVSRFCKEVGVANGFFDKVKSVGSDKILKILNLTSTFKMKILYSHEQRIKKNHNMKTANFVLSLYIQILPPDNSYPLILYVPS